MQAVGPERVDQSQDVRVVGDAEVGAHLVPLEIEGADNDYNLDLFGHLFQHDDLVVGREARQDTGGVVVVEELAPELEVELAPELPAPFVDVL